MIKMGNWWVPDDTAIVKNLVITENFTCIEPLQKAFKHVKKFDNAIDIGTWIGDSTSHIAKHFNNVIAFEANTKVFDCCLKNLDDRNITNCKVSNLGVSNSNGKKNFFNGKSNFNGWLSTKTEYEPDVAISNNFIIETVSLDTLNLKDIDFVKIDVDSHEGFLLDGARKFLTVNSPVIMIENKPRSQKERQSSDMPDPVEILTSLGYVLVEKVAKADFIFVKVEQ